MANSNKTTVTKASQTSGFARWQVFKLALAGLDYFTAFIGTEINDKLVNSLREVSSKIAAVSFKTAKTAILFVDAGANGSTRFYAWSVKVQGDAYQRIHADENGKMNVVGSVNALKSVFGANRVRFVSLKEVSALAQKQKMDKGCAADLGISLAVAKAAKAKGKGKAVAA